MTIDVESVEFINVPPGSTLLITVPPYVMPEACSIARDALLAKNIPNVRDVIVVANCEVSVLVPTNDR